MAFTKFNRQGHKEISAEIEKELAALGQRLGIKFSVGGGVIGTTDLTIKVIATSADPSIAEANAKRELDMHGRYYGLEGNDYGAIFNGAGGVYKLTGVSPNRPKYPIDGECVRTGKRYKFTRSVVSQIVAKRGVAPTQTQHVPVFNTPQPQISPSSNNGQTDDRYAGAGMF